MLLARWMNPACTKTTVTSRYDSPAATACLSRPNSVNQKAWLSGLRMDEKPMPIVTASRAHVTMGVGAPLRRARPGTLGGGGARFRLAVGVESTAQVARAYPVGSQALPGHPAERRLGCARSGLPGGPGAGLVVEPVATGGGAGQRGHG